MNDKFILTAEKREITGKKVKTLREAGFIPGVMYGHDTKPQLVSIKASEFEKVFHEAGTSSLVDLVIGDNTPAKVLTHEPQYHPVTDKPIHIDFYKVRMDEKIKTEIPLKFSGESEAVEQLDGSLVTNRDNVEVECLPSDLINEIDIDLSVLKTFDDVVTVADLKVPSTVEILSDKDDVIALVEPPRSEEELAELETPTAAEEEKEAIEKMGAEAEAEAEKAEGEEGEGEESENKTAEPEKAPEKKK